jgi:phosphoribosylglycinamide formyltransferase-1
MRIAILISGRGSNMLALIEAAQSGRIPDSKIVIVISDKADAAGIARARERGIETRVIERRKLRGATPDEKFLDRERARFEHEQAIIAELKARDVELICLAGFMRLLSPHFIESFRNSIVNIHPSLLPAFPGLNAQRQALEYGVKFTGCTVHFVDESLDGGAIIAQRVVPVYETDSEESLSLRILKEEHAAYVEAVAQIARGAIEIIGRRVKSKNL